jgi:hypothetical protein
MEQLNTYILYLLGSRLQAIFLAAKMPVQFFSADVDLVLGLLDMLLAGTARLRLDESAVAAQALRAQLLATKDTQDGDSFLEPQQVEFLNATIRSFDAAIGLELGRAPIFYVSPKGTLDTRRLILNAACEYDGYRDRLPEEAIKDTNNAGRCLAFALPTAAGFHIARATEAVIKECMVVFGCPPIREAQRNWGNYIKALRERGANPKVLHHLEQIKDLHRNPLIHPEVTLGMQEARSLWAICISAVQAMVADMETRRPNPSGEIMTMLPPSPDFSP